MSDTNDATLRAILASARQQHHAGAGSVLDVLLRSEGQQAQSLLDQLASRSGVMVLRDAAGLEPDFSRWDLAAARESRCVVLRNVNGTLLAAAADPWDDENIGRLVHRLGRVVPPAAAPQALLDLWLGNGADLRGPIANGVGADTGADGPIVDFVDAALRVGIEVAASDVHFECDRAGVTVKHRRDGVLVRFARLDGATPAQEAISRIKVMAQLDITERRLPQDGRFRYAAGSTSVDLRVSIMPSVFGEDAVLRILDRAQLRESHLAVSLDSLGFDLHGATRIRELAAQPSGMLLITGPTGSGKTTTVYAILSEINTGLEKIVTIEDPVEYELPGVLQIPVNERKGLTFAKGLRSILRHDPDRILVGEIRDAETAEIAVQSALTGHLVFTTVHANSMTDIMGRFRHFGLDIFGFMSSLNAVVVQRLVRRLCTACAQRRDADSSEREWLTRRGHPDATSVPRAVGCASCFGTGYRGRFVIAEVHGVDDNLRDHVTQGAPMSVLRHHAEVSGVVPLAALAATRVMREQTTLEEVRRVVGWL